MRILKLTVFLFLITTGIIFASENDFELITLEDAINMAYENNEEIQIAMKENVNYDKQRGEAIRSYLPKLDYGFNLGLQEEISLMDNSETAYIHKITITQPIYNGGLEIAAIKNSSIATELGDLQVNQKKQDIKMKVMESYVEVLKAKRAVEIMEASLEELELNYDRLEEMFEEGMITEAGLIEMRYNVINLESNLIGLENGHELAKLSLKNIIGMEQNINIELEEVEFNLTEFDDIDFDKELERGLANNLDLKMVKLSTRLSEASEDLTKAGLLPNVNFQFNYKSPQGIGSFTLGDSIKFEDWTWNAGLSFNYNLWDWGKSKSKFDRAKNDTKKSELNQQSAEKGIELAIYSSYLEIDRLTMLIEAKEEALKSAKQNYELASAKHREMLITTDELVSAENKVRSSETELENAKLDFYIAKQRFYKIVAREEF